MEQSPLSMFLLLSTWFVFSQSNTTSEYSIYHFCIMIKDFSISFPRVIIVQDFENVTFSSQTSKAWPKLFRILNEALIRQSLH